MPPKCFESEVESFLEGSHGDRTHNKQRADHHTVTPLCGTLLFFALRTQPCGDDATNDTSTATDAGQRETTITNARPQTATIETGITSAPENCTENAHFAPAKAMAVSVEARPAPAKATGVSDKRAAWLASSGCVTSRYQCARCPKNSHAIRLGEVSTTAGNAAIPTL